MSKPENPIRGERDGNKIWTGFEWYELQKPLRTFYSHQLFNKLKEVRDWMVRAYHEDSRIPGGGLTGVLDCKWDELDGRKLIEEIKQLIEAKDDIEDN